jgi:TPR repeat protein
VGDKSELQKVPRAVDALVLSEARASLIARARTDAARLVTSKPVPDALSAVRSIGVSPFPNLDGAQEQFRRGLFYAKGIGVAEDCAQAAIWYRKAADQGHASAQSALGWLYEEGQGVPRDYGQAAYWYQKAAEQGHPSAQFQLGLAYKRGQGVLQDYEEACFWLDVSMESLKKACSSKIHAFLNTERVKVAAKLTSDERSKVQTRVAQWLAANPPAPQKTPFDAN